MNLKSLIFSSLIGLSHSQLMAQDFSQIPAEKSLWVDQFQNPNFQTEFKGFWYNGTDASNTGKSKIYPEQINNGIEAKSAGSADKALHIRYKLDKGGFQWDPYISWATSTKATDWKSIGNTPINTDSIVGIAYEFKGAAHSFLWQISSVTDYANYQKPIAESAEWKTVIIPVKDLKQPSWGHPETKDIAKTTGFAWQVMGKTGDSADVWIDNIRLIKAGGLPGVTVGATDFIKSTGIAPSSTIDKKGWIKKPKYGKVSPLLWPENKKAAFSLTFDDGLRSQYQNVIPLLKKYNQKGTFFLVTNTLENDPSVEPSWRYGWWHQFEEIAKMGHEVASHTYSHAKLNDLAVGNDGAEKDPSTLEYQLAESQKTMKLHFPKLQSMSFAYPFGDCPDHVHTYAGKYYYASREIGHGGVNPSVISDFNTIYGGGLDFPLGKPRTSASDSAQVNAFIKNIDTKVIPYSGWGVMVAHDVFEEQEAWAAKDTWMPQSTQTLEQILKYLQKNESVIWTAPFGEVAQYAKERQNLQSGVLKEGDKMEIVIDDGLDDMTYSQKVWVNISVPKTWKRAAVIQGSEEQNLNVQEGNILAQVLPKSNKIIVMKK